MPNSSKSLEVFITKTFASRHAISVEFYDRLFAEIPETKSFFKDDFAKQKHMFTMMMGTIAKSQAGVSNIEELGARLRVAHSGHNISVEFLLTGGKVLKEACESVLKDVTSPDERQRLYEVIDRITSAMTSKVTS